MPIKLMMFIRKKKKDGRIYYYIVEAIRKKNKVQQKVLLYLGTAEAIYNKLKALKKKGN